MIVKIIKGLLYWTWIPLVLANGFFLYRLASAFVPVKEKRLYQGMFFLLFCGTSGMVIWVGDNNLLMTLPVFLLFYMLSTQGPWLGRLATAVVFFCLIMSVSAILDTYLMDIDKYDIAVRVLRPVVFGALYVLLRPRLPREPVQLSQRLWKLVLGLSAMPLCALVAVVLLTYQRYDLEPIYSLSLRQGLVVLPFVLLSSAMILLAIRTLEDYERLTREKNLAASREVYYQGILREQTQVRTLRHDLRNHLTALRGLIEKGETEKAQDYLNQILGSPAMQGSRQLCENETANAVLAAKAEDMARRGIAWDFRVALPPSLPVADTDLCALLGNALDNAMEAAEKTEDKRVTLRCRMDKGMLMLRVRNPLAGDETADLTTTKPDKKHHGLGLAGMREIAARYGGTLEAGPEGDYFELLVCLPLKDDL
ncbi:MAG: sensor histidine kinase [Faecousia sp.]